MSFPEKNLNKRALNHNFWYTNNFLHWNTTKISLFVSYGRMKIIDLWNSDFWKLDNPYCYKWSWKKFVGKRVRPAKNRNRHLTINGLRAPFIKFFSFLLCGGSFQQASTSADLRDFPPSHHLQLILATKAKLLFRPQFISLEILLIQKLEIERKSWYNILVFDFQLFYW